MKPRAVLWLVHLAVCAMVLLFSPSARAYPWMIRHGYTGCVPCHTDPSGGAGVLTEYGRAQSDLLLRMRYTESSESGEADNASKFLWGLIPTPGELRLGADFARGVLQQSGRGGSRSAGVHHDEGGRDRRPQARAASARRESRVRAPGGSPGGAHDQRFREPHLARALGGRRARRRRGVAPAAPAGSRCPSGSG